MVHSMVPHAKVSTAKQAHGTPAQLGQVRKTRQKWDWKKFGKFTGHIYPCRSLTDIQYYEAQAVTGNENRIYWNLPEKIG